MLESFSQLAMAKAYPAVAAIVGKPGVERRNYIYAQFKADERRVDDIADYLRIIDQRAISRGERVVWICIEQPIQEAA